MAGGYVQRFVGPYPLTYSETATGETRYYGRIDGTFIAEYGHDFVLKKSVRTPLPSDIAEKPEDKFTIKACRFALCAELYNSPSGITAVFEIVSTKPPFEVKKFNKRAPQRMEQYYLPHSYVCGLIAMRTDTSFSSVKVASSTWDHAADFVIDRNAWDFFSTVYPGPESNCFRSIRSNPHHVTEANQETHDGYFLPQDGEAKFYNTHARQAFQGSDNNPFDIQSIFVTDSTLLFDFTIQDSLNTASVYTPVFSYRFSVKGDQGTISSSGSRKVVYRLNEHEVITFTGGDEGNRYTLRRETL